MSVLGLQSGYTVKYCGALGTFLGKSLGLRPYFTIHPASRPNTDTKFCFSARTYFCHPQVLEIPCVALKIYLCSLPRGLQVPRQGRYLLFVRRAIWLARQAGQRDYHWPRGFEKFGKQKHLILLHVRVRFPWSVSQFRWKEKELAQIIQWVQIIQWAQNRLPLVWTMETWL